MFNKTNVTNSTTADAVVASAITWMYLPTVVCVLSLGFPANTLVIRRLLGKAGICSTSDIFTLTIAAFDLIFCVCLFVEFVLNTNNSKNPNFFICWGLSQFGVPLLICLMCLDLYLAVCHPVAFLQFKAPKWRITLCLTVTVLTILFCSSLKLYKDPIFKLSVISFALFLALIITSFSNIMVLRLLRQSGPTGKDVHPIKKRAFKSVLTVFVLINVLYMPPLVVYFIGVSITKGIDVLIYMMVSVRSFMQPLCYLIRTNQLPKVTCHGSPSEIPSISNLYGNSLECVDLLCGGV